MAVPRRFEDREIRQSKSKAADKSVAPHGQCRRERPARAAVPRKFEDREFLRTYVKGGGQECPPTRPEGSVLLRAAVPRNLTDLQC